MYQASLYIKTVNHHVCVLRLEKEEKDNIVKKQIYQDKYSIVRGKKSKK